LDQLEVQEAFNADWESGMGSSVRTGIERLVSIDADVAAAVLLLCDQPHVTPKVVSSLLAAHHTTRKPVIASAYGESFGVPAVFSRTLFRELMGLAGSSGAKEVIKRHFSEAHFLPFPEGEVDVDTPDDFSCLT
jgi:molybdenum cofactor cytidylyltransferase